MPRRITENEKVKLTIEVIRYRLDQFNLAKVSWAEANWKRFVGLVDNIRWRCNLYTGIVES